MKMAVLRNRELATSQIRMSTSQLALSSQDESSGIYEQAVQGSNCAAMCSKPVWCLFVYSSIYQWMTAQISWLQEINRKCFDGKEVWWWLSEELHGILHETDPKYLL
jgi:hypothetical protein